MTGRELILYILENHLENEHVFEDGKFIGYMTLADVAEKYNVSTATVSAWIVNGQMEAVTVAGNVYIPRNATVQR